MAPSLPRVFLLPTHLEPDELRHLEEAVPSLTQLTHDANEADVLVGRISKRARALFELRRLKLRTAAEARNERNEEGGRSAVKVVKLAWLEECLERDQVLPVDDYLVYGGFKVPPAAEEDAERGEKTATISASSESQSQPRLARETTEEHDLDEELPALPDYLHTKYSCERPTPRDPPNAAFIAELKDIRTLRVLQGDQIGLRAYSTAIAALAAYPFPLRRPKEITRLPGCSEKIAELYQQWSLTGRTREMREADNDPRVAVLRQFYDIWGVGETTAREFYNKGWRDLDDIIEHGWHSLSRAQQIGVKYYDEFKLTIPRAEVEKIGATILSHARGIDPGFEMMIVGGYRRGKQHSGDVDVVLSHREEAKTLRVIEELVAKLEGEGHISHLLSLSTQGSERGQMPSAWRDHGSGFDTLDKALVVWKGPASSSGRGTSREGVAGREGGIHRRVDIIVSPWRTVGCAVLGWSGATTFERDLRRYCKEVKGLRFDSSGIRRRRDGAWVDVENAGGEGGMEEAERRVFAGLGLAWREPTERCTG